MLAKEDLPVKVNKVKKGVLQKEYENMCKLKSMINVLKRATGMIKLVGSWMMIMAGIGLTLFLTNQSAVSAVFG